MKKVLGTLNSVLTGILITVAICAVGITIWSFAERGDISLVNDLAGLAIEKIDNVQAAQYQVALVEEPTTSNFVQLGSRLLSNKKDIKYLRVFIDKPVADNDNFVYSLLESSNELTVTRLDNNFGNDIMNKWLAGDRHIIKETGLETTNFIDFVNMKINDSTSLTIIGINCVEHDILHFRTYNVTQSAVALEKITVQKQKAAELYLDFLAKIVD
jgi:hypothetical protein